MRRMTRHPQAAILTGRRSKSAISNKEVDDSVDRIVAGMEGTPMVDGKAKSLVAYHEVGHAICGTLTAGPRCRAEGARRVSQARIDRVSIIQCYRDAMPHTSMAHLMRARSRL